MSRHSDLFQSVPFHVFKKMLDMTHNIDSIPTVLMIPLHFTDEKTKSQSLRSEFKVTQFIRD